MRARRTSRSNSHRNVGRRNRRSDRLLRLGCLLAVALPTLITVAWLYTSQFTRRPAPPPLNRVAAWMPTSWDTAQAMASWEAHRDQIHEISPVWYQVSALGDGTIIPYNGSRDQSLVAAAHADGVLVIPLINNAYEGIMDPAPVSAVIHDPALRAAHVAALVSETLTYGYDGIDVDYESLDGFQDREPLSLFVEELAAALHAEGKLLAVTVHPKTYEPGSWSGPRAQDWERIGQVADRFRLMTYNYHWSGGPAGPIAPLWWLEDVLDLATRTVPPNQVYLGVHLYGMDWGNGETTPLTWTSAQALMTVHGTSRQWAAADANGNAIAEPWFTYTRGPTQHDVWYADAASVGQRARLVERYGLGGIVLWRLGGEDPECWSAIAGALRSTILAP